MGGKLKFQRGTVDFISIGDTSLGEISTSFLKTAAGIYSKSDIAGGVGPDVLKNFDVVFDYSHQTLWLRPNVAFVSY